MSFFSSSFYGSVKNASTNILSNSTAYDHPYVSAISRDLQHMLGKIQTLRIRAKPGGSRVERYTPSFLAHDQILYLLLE